MSASLVNLLCRRTLLVYDTSFQPQEGRRGGSRPPKGSHGGSARVHTLTLVIHFPLFATSFLPHPLVPSTLLPPCFYPLPDFASQDLASPHLPPVTCLMTSLPLIFTNSLHPFTSSYHFSSPPRIACLPSPPHIITGVFQLPRRDLALRLPDPRAPLCLKVRQRHAMPRHHPRQAKLPLAMHTFSVSIEEKLKTH